MAEQHEQATTERPITFSQAATLNCVPPRRGGKPPHVSFFVRAATVGCGGVKLKASKIFAIWYTTPSAVATFFDELMNAGRHPKLMARSTPQQNKKFTKAVLANAGI